MDARDLKFAAGSAKLVTVGRYRDLPDADIARSVLESAGIQAYLQDEHVVSLNWNMSDVIGGLRLQVEAADEQATVELLRQPALEAIAFGDGKKFVQPRCPTCNSGDVSMGQYYGVADPRPADRDVWRCNACRECWEETED
jgi:hypothetical protein